MTLGLSETILAAFLIFCRIGACLMIVPGYSSNSIPSRIRLFIAFAITLAFTPIVLPMLQPLVNNASHAAIFGLIASELMIGAVIALMGRMFFLALQTLATAVAMAIGLSTMPGVPVEDTEALPALAPLVTVTASALFFLTDQHWEVLRGLAASYQIWRPADGLDVQLALTQITERLSEAFMLTLRISSPFMIYAVVVNLAVGLANKLTPSIPVYFIAVPFVMFGGLMLLYLTVSEFLLQFMIALAAWLSG